MRIVATSLLKKDLSQPAGAVMLIRPSGRRKSGRRTAGHRVTSGAGHHHPRAVQQSNHSHIPSDTHNPTWVWHQGCGPSIRKEGESEDSGVEGLPPLLGRILHGIEQVTDPRI